MIRIFAEKETNFSHDGIEILDEITISCVCERHLNGTWFLNAEFIRDDDRSSSIENRKILKVPTPKGEQLFRIVTIKSTKTKINVYAEHIFFDNRHNFIEDTNVVRKDGNNALQQILGSCQYKTKFTGISTVPTVASARLVRKNLTEALMGDRDNSYLNRWGGEIDFDNFNFTIKPTIGENRGVEVSYGHNMQGFEGEIDESGIVTRVMPMGFNGLLLPEKYVDSPLINSYAFPKIQVIEISSIKVKENEDDEDGYETEEQAFQAMREYVSELFSKQNIDKPSVNLRVNIISLEKTDQYKNEVFERMYIGDTLKVSLEKYGFDVSCRIISERYDSLNSRYIEIELGEIKSNILKDVISIKDTIDDVLSQIGVNSWQELLDQARDEASQLIQEGIKNSFVVARKNEILIMDSEQVETARNVIRMNKNGIAFSKTGYSGPYVIGITIDGKINADCITTGVLNASLIKAGRLQSLNNKTWIDMEDGTFNLSDKIIFDGENLEITLQDGKTIEQMIDDSGNKSGNMILNSNVLVDLTGFEAIGGTIARYEYIPPIEIEDEEEFTPGESEPNVPDEVEPEEPPTKGDDIQDIEIVKPPATSNPIVSNTQLHFLYTRETGDCIIITCDNGKVILIDNIDNRLIGSQFVNCTQDTISYIRKLGIKKIDYIINTHFHSDHAGGLDEIMYKFDVKNSIFIYKEFNNANMPSIETEWKTNVYKTNAINAANSNGMKRVIPTEKQKFIIDDNTYFQIYNATHMDYSDYNGSSLVIYFVHKNNKFLLLGDLNVARQETLYSTLPQNVDVVKDSHHGYNSTINPNLIKRCNPKDVVVTRNVWTNYGYTRAYNSIGMWQSYEKNIYTTFKTGSHIIITSNGKDYTFNTNTKFYFENCWLKFNSDNSSWCYFKPGGKYARNETLILEGKKYIFDSNGFCTNPFTAS